MQQIIKIIIIANTVSPYSVVAFFNLVSEQSMSIMWVVLPVCVWPGDQ